MRLVYGILGYGIFSLFYFGIWDIDPIYFGIWDIQEIWDIGIYFGIRVNLNQFGDMGYFGWFILGYGILPTPLTKPHL